MARTELSRRVAALEGVSVEQARGPCLWVVREEGETSLQALTRLEADSGPFGERQVLVWQPPTDIVA